MIPGSPGFNNLAGIFSCIHAFDFNYTFTFQAINTAALTGAFGFLNIFFHCILKY